MSVPPNVNGTAGETVTGMTDGINHLGSPVPRLSLAQGTAREQGSLVLIISQANCWLGFYNFCRQLASSIHASSARTCTEAYGTLAPPAAESWRRHKCLFSADNWARASISNLRRIESGPDWRASKVRHPFYSLSRYCQTIFFHFMSLKGLPAKEPQWRPHPSIPAYPAPTGSRPTGMPYQQRYITPPDDRPPSLG